MADRPRKSLKPVGVGLLLVVSLAVCALALGWRPIKPPPPEAEQVSPESLEQARQQDAETQKKVESGDVIIGGP